MQTFIICSGTQKSYLGTPGSVAPKCQYVQSTALELVRGHQGSDGTSPLLAAARPVPLKLGGLQSSTFATTGIPGQDMGQLQGHNLLVTVPVTLDRRDREAILESAFEHRLVESCFLLAEPIAAVFSVGLDAARVVDLGASRCTVSFVEDGQVVKFATSTTLGVHAVERTLGEIAQRKSQKTTGNSVQKGKDDDEADAQPRKQGSSDDDDNEDAAGSSTFREPTVDYICGNKKKNLSSLLARLPDESVDHKILLVGGGAEAPGAIDTFRRYFPQDDVIAYNKPSHTVFTGASLFGDLEGVESQFFISRRSYQEDGGKALVHWMCPE